MTQSATAYEQWAEWCKRLRSNPDVARERLQQLRHKPSFLLLIADGEASQDALGVTLDSLETQRYSNWRAVVCTASPDDPDASGRAPGSSTRQISVVQGASTAEALNAVISGAREEYVGFIEAGDELSPDALLESAAALQAGTVDALYCDHDVRLPDGRRHDPFCKPVWAPDLFLEVPYLLPFCLFRAEHVRSIGPLDPDLDGAHAYELALRCTSRAESIAHVPMILCHRSSARNPDAEREEAAVRRALAGRDIDAAVERSGGGWTIRRPIVSPLSVTIVIPTRDNLALLSRCIASIEALTTYRPYTILIVDNGSKDPDTLRYLEATPHRVLRDDGPFNYSRLNNRAAGEADGHFLLLLNDDTEVIDGEWLGAMVEQAQRPEIGAVGAKLLFPDGRIQHAGLVLGVGGIANPAEQGLPGDQPGYHRFAEVVREYSAVTGACMMLRRDVFVRVGGLNEGNLPIAFNDVDLCLRLRQAGYRILFTPHAVLHHAESASRQPGVRAEEDAYMRRTWGPQIEADPYYNPNLTRTALDFAVDVGKPDGMLYDVQQTVFDAVTAPLVPGAPVQQPFIPEGDGVAAIGVRFATYERAPSARIRLRVLSVSPWRRQLASVEIQDIVADNEERVFLFAPLRGVRGRKLVFSIERLSEDAEQAISLWRSSETVPAFGPCSEGTGTLAFRLFREIGSRVAN